MRFTVRRPASAEVSPCCHRPSGGDVACSVHVGVARPCLQASHSKTAWLLRFPGAMCPHAEHRCDVYAAGTCSIRPISLVLQARGEHTPSASANGPVEAALLGDPLTGLLDGSACRSRHSAHVKCFDANRVEAPRDIGSGLLDPVLASVSLTRSKLRDRLFRASPTVGAALCAGQALLQHGQPLRLARGETRGVQQFAGRRCRRHHRGRGVRVASTVAARPPGSTHTGHGGNAQPAPPPAQR